MRRGAELLHIPLEQLVRSGAISLAKREILTRKHLGSEGESDTPRSGVAGSADHRIQQAFEFLQQASKEITPARLAKLSRTNFNSAQRWIGLNHPQLLLNQKLRPRQARPMREKPAASQQQASPHPRLPHPNRLLRRILFQSLERKKQLSRRRPPPRQRPSRNLNPSL